MQILCIYLSMNNGNLGYQENKILCLLDSLKVACLVKLDGDGDTEIVCIVVYCHCTLVSFHCQCLFAACPKHSIIQHKYKCNPSESFIRRAPVSSKERVRLFRERLKTDPARYEAYKAASRERVRVYRSKLKSKKHTKT